MNSGRDAMLQRIREAVAAGNHAGGSPPLPDRGKVGYQGGGDDLVARFRSEWTAAGGKLHVVPDVTAAARVIAELAQARSIRRVLLGGGKRLEAVCPAGVDIVAESPSAWFGADMGISGVDYLVAETGSIILASRPEQPRSLSLLPPLHVAFAERSQLIPDLFDLFEVLGMRLPELPSSFSVITGPSKTGDIELRLVTGVHGPGEVHVVLLDAPAEESLS